MSDLGKWPRLYVSGQKVAPEQADLILIRTADVMGLVVNDETWGRMVYRTLGVPVDGGGYPSYEEREAAEKRFGMLGLAYLGNERIATCHADGPNGWCDWDGSIACADGGLHSKWPTVDGLFSEWNRIARAFPFLRLTAQVTTAEWGDDGTTRTPLYQWEVADGVARMVEVGPLLHPIPPESSTWETKMENYLTRRDAVRRRGWGFEPHRNAIFPERGVTWERLKTAVERARVK
jgi:hypothetical protein